MRAWLAMVLTFMAATAWAASGTHFPLGATDVPIGDLGRDVVWAQLPPTDGGYAYASHTDSDDTWYAESADDFFMSSLYPVMAVEWWGIYVPAAPPFVEQFVIRFYTDVPADPPDVPFSHPGDLVYESSSWTFLSELWDPEIGTYRYEADLLDPPPLASGEIYWISIQAILPYDRQWGWAQCDEEYWWNDEAVMDFAMFNVPRWTPFSQVEGLWRYGELAFVLYDMPFSAVEEMSWGNIKALYR